MNAEHRFISPDGNRLMGAAQCGGEDVWPVIWEEDATDPTKTGAFDYRGDGPDSSDWDTITVDGATVFTDVTGTDWLDRHLIPADLAAAAGHPETWGLTAETCTLMQLDLQLHLRARDAKALHDDLDAVRQADFNTAYMARKLAEDAAAAKARAMEAKEREIAVMRAGGWTRDGDQKDPTAGVDPVKAAAEGVEHLRWARECFTAAGSRQTLKRVASALSSGKGAVRAAGYRVARRVEEGARRRAG